MTPGLGMAGLSWPPSISRRLQILPSPTGKMDQKREEMARKEASLNPIFSPSPPPAKPNKKIFWCSFKKKVAHVQNIKNNCRTDRLEDLPVP